MFLRQGTALEHRGSLVENIKSCASKPISQPLRLAFSLSFIDLCLIEADNGQERHGEK